MVKSRYVAAVISAVCTVASATPTPLAEESLLAKLLRIAGLTAAPSQLRARGDELAPGAIWIVNLDQQTARALTTEGGYRSPVFSPADRNIYALRGDAIVRIPADGASTAIAKAPGAIKLVGFDAQNPDDLVVLLDAGPGQPPLAVVSLKNQTMSPLPFDPKSAEERAVLAQVRAQDRIYGKATVYTKTESKQGMTSRTIEWIDVYLQQGSTAPQNVSKCNGVNCGQPALSPDGQSIAFVKSM
jgi:hypothetical protein